MITDKQIGAYEPQTNEESNGEIMGRVNAVHDWLLVYAITHMKSKYGDRPLDDGLMTVAALLGFADVLRIEKVEPNE